jgi:hypothetical protein
MKLAGQGDGRDRARIFVITCRLVGRRPWFSGKGTASDNAACYNGAASFSGRAETQATKRRHTAIASRFKSCGPFAVGFFAMSALPRKADIAEHGWDVRFVAPWLWYGWSVGWTQNRCISRHSCWFEQCS